MYDIDDLKNLVDMAAGGRNPADLLITNAKLVDVLTGEIRETDVSVGRRQNPRLLAYRGGESR